MLEFRILGPFEVAEHARPVLLGGPKQRALLAILLLHRGKVVTSDRLIDELWGGRPPATAAKTLQGYVWHLRQGLGNEVLITRGGGYLLVTASGQVDAEQFETLVADARLALAAGEVAGARERLGSALELWRGEALADLAYEPFAQGEIARLEEARLAAVEDRIEADLLLGQHRSLVGELEALVGRHPHRERLLGQLMLALYRSGRQADALDVYRRGRQALSDELGLESGDEVRALEQRILTHDTGLELPTPAVSARIAAGPRRPPRGRTLISAGGALLLAAAIAASITALSGGGNLGLRAAPNSVAAIDTRTNRVVGQVAVGARPSGIVFGSGSLWVANLDDQTVSRVDPRALRTLRTLSAGGPPTGIASAGGRVWVVASNSSVPYVSVSRIDPQFDAIAPTARIANVVPGGPGTVAARDATVWVAASSGPLARLDPRTGRVTTRLDPNAGPTGIALGADAVWVTDSNANNVTRVDPTGLVTSQPVGPGPSGIAVGEGAVWVTDTLDDTLIRIDPSTKAPTSTIAVGRSPAGVSLGAGSVWVANSGDGTVTRIDPRTNRVQATILVGGSPQAITVAGGRAWVSVDARTLPTIGPQAGGGTARLVSSYDVDYMDPALAYGRLSEGLLYATCAKLLNYPDKSGPAGSQLVPEVAASLPARSVDGESYTFTIRPGFRFSPPSNETVTARTFKATIERSLNPRMKSPVAGQFGDIVGARAYMAGRTAHIGGVIARGDTLTIRLGAPAPDLLSRTTETALCAVPSDTPIDPQGVRMIPSAGPYRVASYTPGQGVVLTRNPNYHGSRPHRLARIELTVGISDQRAVARVEAGTADYLVDGGVPTADAGALATRYGPGSPAAKSGRQQYFVNAGPQLDLFALNTHRPLFADPRVRRAANYAIDRTRLARLGDEYTPLPASPTDHYLPPGLPGYAKLHVYPYSPDVAKARQLAAGRGRRIAVLYTCNIAPCDQQAQIIKTDLAAIGIRLTVKAFEDGTLYAKTATPGEPFDIAWLGWVPDYLDPNAILTPLLEGGTMIPTLDDPHYRARIAAAAQLTGTRRYLTYARLDADLTRHAAPFIAFGNSASHDLFSARMGCQVFTIYGMDLANLCIR